MDFPWNICYCATAYLACVAPEKSTIRHGNLFANTQGLPGGFDELPLWRRTAHALYPSKALKFIEAMSGPTCPAEQLARLRTALIPLRQANVQAQSLRLSHYLGDVSL
jgi:hypothetical protein